MSALPSSGELIGAGEALRCGLVDRVVPAEGVAAFAERRPPRFPCGRTDPTGNRPAAAVLEAA
jgi:enoyl-CoA hydratase/carnithine racemase